MPAPVRDVRFVDVPIVTKMADIPRATILGQNGRDEAMISIKDTGFPFDLPGQFCRQGIEGSERTQQLIIRPAAEPRVPGKAVPNAAFPSIVIECQQPVRNPLSKINAMRPGMAV